MKRQMAKESEGLGPLVSEPMGIDGKRLAIGMVPGVNDAGATLVENFAPTRYELEVLANHYLEEVRAIEFDGEFLGSSGSYEIRMRPFAYRRLDAIWQVLGEESFKKAIAPMEEKWQKVFAEARKGKRE